MSFDRRDRNSSGPSDHASTTAAPGKRTLTSALQFARRPAVQRAAVQADAAAAPAATQDDLGARATATPEQVHEVAALGVAGSGDHYPHAATIQHAFGHHDLGDARAHVGGAAAAASDALGARAYATGDHVAFAASPDLHTAAHEAAHVIQQRGGVQLAGGVGAAGDPYERHADAVADRVVAGGSAVDLLDSLTGGGIGGGVQRKAVQFWDSHEHRAAGNMGALIATGEANFDVNSWMKTHAKDTFSHKDVTKTGGLQQSSDPTLVDLENKATKSKSASALSVANAPTVIANGGPGGAGGATVIDNKISFGGMSELGGDFARTPEALLATEGDNPTGNDYVTMALIGASNINHFYPLNAGEYRTHHAKALDAAKKGDRRNALVEEGFASHFLEDCFAAGHMAPRALDRVNPAGEKELGLNRSKMWHDALNAVAKSDGLPTTRGRFHGDDTMTGRELAIIGQDVGASLKEVLTTLAGKPVPANIALPVPDVSAIMKDPDYGPIWRRMMDDYAEDLDAAEKKPGSMTTDGGTTDKTANIASSMRHGIYGDARPALTRVTSSQWNGPVLVFNVTVDGKPAPAGTKVYVKWFDCDLGYDRDATGRDAGIVFGENGGGFNDTDSQVGPNKPAPDVITVSEAGVAQARGGEDNDGDTYGAFYSDRECMVPIGRSMVQGTNKGKVTTPVTVSELSWSQGKTLGFKVKKADGTAAVGRTVYVQFFDCDSSFDRDAGGYKGQTIVDGDPAGGVQTVQISRADGFASVVPTGKDDNPNDTYAVVYLDAARQIPLGRSPLQPGSFYQ